MEKIFRDKEMEESNRCIEKFCYNYGYMFQMDYDDWDYEGEMELMIIDEYPDDFYECFGKDAIWNSEAEYWGREEALCEITGKSCNVYGDKNRVVAIIEEEEE